MRSASGTPSKTASAAFRAAARILRCGSVFFALALAAQGFAQTKAVTFSEGGATAYDGWSNLTYFRLSSANYGAWPGNQDWTQAIAAHAPGSGGGSINRLAKSPNGGGPYPGEFSLYFGSSKLPIVPNTLGGTLGVSRAPASGVKTVVFQIELGEGEPQGQTRYFFHEPVGNPTGGRPTLYVNGVAVATPTFTTLLNQRITSGGGESGEDDVYINTYGYQWNIATANVSSLEIRFSCVEHVSIYSMRLDQTSVLQSNNVFDTGSTAPAISLSGTGLSFGSVVTGSSKTGTLTINNTGSATLNVSGITYPRGLTGNWSSGAITAGSSQNVTVTFAPASATTLSGDIAVTSNATSGGNAVSVSGSGAPPAIRQNATGTAQYNGSVTSVTHRFNSTFNTVLQIEYTDNLTDPNSWVRHPGTVNSGNGQFDVTFSKSGDHRVTWSRGMYFRLIYQK